MYTSAYLLLAETLYSILQITIRNVKVSLEQKSITQPIKYVLHTDDCSIRIFNVYISFTQMTALLEYLMCMYKYYLIKQLHYAIIIDGNIFCNITSVKQTNFCIVPVC